MNEVLKALLVSFLPSLIIAVITAKLTVDLSIRRFRNEKWWEKKHETYERVIVCLSKLLYCFREYIKLNNGSAGPISVITKDRLADKYCLALEEFSEIADASIFNISDKAATELNKLRNEIEGEPDKAEWSEDAGYKYELIESCIRDIKTYAKEDLDIEKL